MQIIESVTIRYFRSVYTLTISPCKDITVISGKNDVGKSNIIKALNLFFNQQSDYLQAFDFSEDYSILRREEVRKDTIRGQQFISISIRFLRGDKMQNCLPPSFTVTRRWDMHSPEYKQSSDVQMRMEQYAKKKGIQYSEKTTARFLSVYLNKIKFIYIPAIKDARVFNETLNWLQKSLFNEKNKTILDEPITRANVAVQEIVNELQNDFKRATNIDNFVELPNTLNYTKGLLQVTTQTEGGSVSIDKRGDGIRIHYIPKILNYVAKRSKDTYIWGFEEPENSYEYRRCIQVANEFDYQYSKNCQIFITSHSPAFYSESIERKQIVQVTYIDNKTVLMDSSCNLDEELGYIELYKEFIEKIKLLESENNARRKEIANLNKRVSQGNSPVILTEGKTDAELLKIAIERMNYRDFEGWDIKPILSGTTSNNECLLKFLLDMRNNLPTNSLVIGMFDRDVRLSMRNENDEIDIREYRYIRLAPHVYAFALPVPHNRIESEQISIEHFFTDSEIKTEIDGKRLFLANEFYSTGVYKGDEEFYYKGANKISGTIKVIEHESKLYVTRQDGTGDYSISKAAFVENIKKGQGAFASISFEEFRKIFDVIREIMEDNEEQNALVR